MDKILVIRYDVGDYVPMTFQKWAEPGYIYEYSKVFFYCPTFDKYLNFVDDAYGLCDDNSIAVDLFYVIMFPPPDLSQYDHDDGLADYVMDCLIQSEFENAVWEIVDTYPDVKQKRLSYSIEYMPDVCWVTGIDEGYYFIRTKGLNHD
jgi:hypothetical protein